MTMSPGTTTLGTHMKRRRLELDIRLNAVFKAAGVAKSTWVNWENDRNIPEEFNYRKIEGALQWEPGSVAAALAGGQPTPLPTAVVVRIDAALPPDDEFVRELRKMPLGEEYLRVLIKEYWDDRAREEERIQGRILRMARAAEG